MNLPPAKCLSLIQSLLAIHWSDMTDPTPDAPDYDLDGVEFDLAIQAAVQAIDHTAGVINAKALADALIQMRACEMGWGSYELTCQASQVVSIALYDGKNLGRSLVSFLIQP